jgi:RNA polymerase sigma-70 factor (ECF subfamily)
VDTKESPGQVGRVVKQWSLVFEAHQGPEAAANRAQQALALRYAGAIHRYLTDLVGDPHAADELGREFALRLVRGDLRRAGAGRERFRDLVKSVLYDLIIDHRRRHGAAAAGSVTLPSDEEFLQRWRGELLNRAWEALARQEHENGQPFYTVLRFRAEKPDVRSGEMARQLAPRLGKPMTDVAMRQTLHRARERFGELLLEEVAHSLQSDAAAELQQELTELKLLDYCRNALVHHARK